MKKRTVTYMKLLNPEVRMRLHTNKILNKKLY